MLLLFQRGFDRRTDQRPIYLPGSSTHQHQAGQKDLNHDYSNRRCRGWIASLKGTCEMLNIVPGTQHKLTGLCMWSARGWAAEGLCIPCPVPRPIIEDFSVSTLGFVL